MNEQGNKQQYQQQQQYSQQNQQYQAPPYYYQQPQRKKRLVWPWILGGCVVLVCLIICAAILGVFSNENDTEKDYLAETYEKYIATLYVEGTIAADPAAYDDSYNQEYLIDTIDTLMTDESNVGLLLYIDTPGGEVMTVAELADKVAEYKETTGRPVYAYGNAYAASGGYWLAVAADRFFVNRYCITGSIGVTYGSLLDFSGLLERYGVKVNTITSGAQKSMGSSLEEMSEQTRAIFQGIINEYYSYFVDWIVDQRDIKRETVLQLADGRIYTATQAVAYGLADEVGDYQQCLDAMLILCGEDCNVTDYAYIPPTSWWDMFYSRAAGTNEISSLLTLLPPTGILAYYDGK